MKARKIKIPVSDSIGEVSAEIMEAERTKAIYVFAHGAGAGMNHPFMVNVSRALAALHFGTLRYNFPYVERASKRPDVPAVAEKTVVRVLEKANELFPGVPVLAGGKSFGGRMTSQAVSKNPDLPVKGLVFFGFPLHPPGKPGTERAAHLSDINIPMLFLQGTRDALATIELVDEVCRSLSTATLEKFQGADHSFRAGKQDLTAGLVQAVDTWYQKIVGAAD